MGNNFNKNNLVRTILAAIIVLGLFNFIYIPKTKRINVLKTQIKQTNKEIIYALGTKEPIYQTKSLVKIVRRGLHIKTKDIYPRGKIAKNEYDMMPIRIEFNSNQHTLNECLEQIQGLPITTTIDNLDLHKPNKDEEMAVRIDLTAFIPSNKAHKQKNMLASHLTNAIETTIFKRKVISSNNLKYSGSLKGSARKAIINDIPLFVGDKILGYTLVKIYSNKVILKKERTLYSLDIEYRN